MYIWLMIKTSFKLVINNKEQTYKLIMSKGRVKETFSQSVFALMIAQVIVKILGLVYKLYLTNRSGFGDEGNAIANGGFQIFALILSVVAIGIPTAISKLVAENLANGNYKGAHKIFRVSLIIFSTIGMIGSFTLYMLSDVLANNYLHISETKTSIIALCPSVFLVSLISVFKGYFSGRESIKMTARAQSLDQVTKTISTVVMIEISVLLLKYTNTELMAALSNLATTLGNTVELIFLYKAYRKIIPEISYELSLSKDDTSIRIFEIVKQILIVAMPISLTAIITAISKNIDSTSIVNDLTGLIGYEEAKKQYGILSGKVDALINFPLSFNMAIVTALLPTVASASKNIKSKETRINQSFLLGLLISFPVTFVFFFFSDEILGLLFPNASSGGDILKISSIQIIFITIEQITNIILNGIGKSTVPIKAIILGVIIKAVLNRVLVHRIDLWFGGTVGASIATLACHLVASLMSFALLIKYTKIKISIKTLIKPALASTIMIIISKISYIILEGKIESRLRLLISLGLGILVFLVLSNHILPIKVINIKRESRKKRILSNYDE